jgi:hypothetical protein
MPFNLPIKEERTSSKEPSFAKSLIVLSVTNDLLR